MSQMPAEQASADLNASSPWVAEVQTTTLAKLRGPNADA